MKDVLWCVLAGFCTVFLIVVGWPYLVAVVVAAALYPMTSAALAAVLVASRGEKE